MHPDIEASFSLSGRIAIVTGAASGIGRELAHIFSKAGSDLVLADIDAAGLEQTASLAEAQGAKVARSKADVTRRAEVDALVETAL